VSDVADVRVAPFQVLAAGSTTLVGREHGWHMTIAERLAAAAPDLVLPTRHRVVDVTDPSQQTEAVAWWEGLTAEGGEGMVVKPIDAIAPGRRGLVPPGIKVRGGEYLRIIYGPTYTEPPHLERLRQRGLGRKRSLAGREFALGIEALERWTRGEPLHRVHECVFAVLALESEPVDPRL
jgi:protein phosphatase